MSVLEINKCVVSEKNIRTNKGIRREGIKLWDSVSAFISTKQITKNMEIPDDIDWREYAIEDFKSLPKRIKDSITSFYMKEYND